MDISRRKAMQVLPLAAIAGATIKVGDLDVQAVEIKPQKQYVFRINDGCTQEDCDRIRDTLIKRGLADSIIIAGNVDIFELDKL